MHRMNVMQHKNLAIALAVVVLHLCAAWGLQSGLAKRAMSAVVQVQVFSEWIEPPKPVPELPPPPLPQPKAVNPAEPLPQPLPLAIVDPQPNANAPMGVVEPPAVVTSLLTSAPVVVLKEVPPAAPAPLSVELPSSDAEYLLNPKPVYPASSKRLGEQGKVVIRVLIGIDGLPQKAEVKQSSGFERLDQAALGTVQRWRFVPGKRGGVPEPMWFNVPINFLLE